VTNGKRERGNRKKILYFENTQHESERSLEGDVQGVEDGRRDVGSISRR
jgi:hypothetical protein